MKIVSIVGARPNYVKLASVYDVFSKFFDHLVVDTGQHYDYEMNRVFFEQLEVPERTISLEWEAALMGTRWGRLLSGWRRFC